MCLPLQEVEEDQCGPQLILSPSKPRGSGTTLRVSLPSSIKHLWKLPRHSQSLLGGSESSQIDSEDRPRQAALISSISAS